MANNSLTTKLKLKDGKIRTCVDPLPAFEIKGLTEQCDLLSAWSPAHLLLTAVESCFFLTLRAIAEKMRIEIEDYESTAEGIVFSDDGRHKEISEIIIRPVIKLKDENNRPKLKTLFEKSHEYCFIARSVKSKIRIEG